MPDFVPDIDEATVQRLVERDFPSGVIDRVHSILATYGTGSHHFERNRVLAAVLKLADGDLLELQRQLGVADADFRDVVGAAEYPAQMKIGFVGMERIGPDRLHELKELDWQEYSAWLART
ncbi:MAG: hypothetical protein EA381_14985 [Planctomycetaceae bacterium]|nr:MAG: hypothetical protein EA381_14985 [Planctomycetaceae bacterium]